MESFCGLFFAICPIVQDIGRMREAQLIINVFLHIDVCCILCSDTGGLSVSATTVDFSMSLFGLSNCDLFLTLIFSVCPE